ncbi:MAG: hypothetical protein PHN79_06915, partial [Methanoregula sp.]|nr:hypothetical protein [Methanoregula sp.]
MSERTVLPGSRIDAQDGTSGTGHPSRPQFYEILQHGGISCLRRAPARCITYATTIPITNAA